MCAAMWSTRVQAGNGSVDQRLHPNYQNIRAVPVYIVKSGSKVHKNDSGGSCCTTTEVAVLKDKHKVLKSWF